MAPAPFNSGETRSAALVSSPARLVVVVEPEPEPRCEAVRVAEAFGRQAGVKVLLAHWHRLEVCEGRVVVAGWVHEVRSGRATERRWLKIALPVDALYLLGAESGMLGAEDEPARVRLAAATGDAYSGQTMFGFFDRWMARAADWGVRSNALGDRLRWGAKHFQELRLREWEASGGEPVQRPETLVAWPGELLGVLRRFAERDQTCMVKPSYGAGGLGIRLVQPREVCAIPVGPAVVQRLVTNAMEVEGHKVDLRFFVLAGGVARRSRRVGPVLLRRAMAPYRGGGLLAEVTNTEFRERSGFLPDVRLLETTSKLDANVKEWVRREVDSLAARLAKVLEGEEEFPLLLGVDALVAGWPAAPLLYFLEMNLFPRLFRGVDTCDEAVSQMLERDYLPALLDSPASHTGRL